MLCGSQNETGKAHRVRRLLLSVEAGSGGIDSQQAKIGYQCVEVCFFASPGSFTMDGSGDVDQRVPPFGILHRHGVIIDFMQSHRCLP